MPRELEKRSHYSTYNKEVHFLSEDLTCVTQATVSEKLSEKFEDHMAKVISVRWVGDMFCDCLPPALRMRIRQTKLRKMKK